MSPNSEESLSPMRVVMVVRLFHPWVGGTELQAQTLAEGLIEQNVSVRIVTGRWFRGTPRREVIGGVPVFRNHTLWEFFGIRGLRRVGGYLYMATLMWHLWRTRATYDVIHIHGMNYHSAVAVRAGRWFKRPSITKLANSGKASDVEKMRDGRQLQGSRFLLPAALESDRFVALNAAVSEELQAVGVPADRIVSLPNGVSLQGITPKPDYAIEARAHLVFVGRLHEQKGLLSFLEALTKLDHRDAVRVSLVGDGPQRAVLEAEVVRLRLEGTVELVGQHDDVRQILAEADLFVLPSLVEGLSNALLEAMAFGLPVVVSNIAGNADVITDDVNGLLFTSEDPESLADCVDRLLSDEPRRARLGRSARLEVEDRYALASVVHRYIAMYDELTLEG